MGRFCNLPKVIQLIRGKASIQAQVSPTLGSEPTRFDSGVSLQPRACIFSTKAVSPLIICPTRSLSTTCD